MSLLAHNVQPYASLQRMPQRHKCRQGIPTAAERTSPRAWAYSGSPRTSRSGAFQTPLSFFSPRRWSPPFTSTSLSRCTDGAIIAVCTHVMYSAPHGGGSGGGLSWKKSHSAGEKKGCGGCGDCRGVTGCLDVLFEAFLPLFGALIVDVLVTFEGSGSGSWYCGLRLSDTDDQTPLSEVLRRNECSHMTLSQDGTERSRWSEVLHELQNPLHQVQSQQEHNANSTKQKSAPVITS